MRYCILFCLLLSSLGSYAQTLNDGLMMPKKVLCTGFMYGHDRWTNYWEGELKRDNENIGKFTTRSLMWAGTYGITDRLNVVAMLPYVKTEASAGNMGGMEGLQDLTLGAKYELAHRDFSDGSLKLFAAAAFSTPLSDYSPDYFPFSLGTHTTNLNWRLNANYRQQAGFYANVSGGYTWRSNTKLDRSAYYTDGQLHMTNEVQMPNVFDAVISTGYLQDHIQAEVFFAQQNTLGGDDIRRQDMPFVSNRMNFSKLGALLMYYLPMHRNLALRASVSSTLAGRNVGQSTTLMGGLMYTLPFSKNQQN